MPVVLLPGQTFDRRIWRPIVERLGDAVHTIAIDLPGQGQSAGPPRPLAEVADQVNHVVERLGVERPIVVGHSMAGAIALIYAARYPVRGVVDIDNPLDVRPFAALIKQLEPALRARRSPTSSRQSRTAWASTSCPSRFARWPWTPSA